MFCKDYQFESYLKNFVNCDNEELELIFESRNRDDVRDNSVNSDIIGKGKFLSFIEVLKKNTRRGYWLVYEADMPIGVMSITMEKNNPQTASLGYYKLNNVSRRGIGKILVKAAIKTAFEKLKIDTLVAECYAKNKKSARVLEACGLTKLGSYTEDNNNKIYIYEIKNPHMEE